jgi:hypothetical protein
VTSSLGDFDELCRIMQQFADTRYPDHQGGQFKLRLSDGSLLVVPIPKTIVAAARRAALNYQSPPAHHESTPIPAPLPNLDSTPPVPSTPPPDDLTEREQEILQVMDEADPHAGLTIQEMARRVGCPNSSRFRDRVYTLRRRHLIRSTDGFYFRS